MSAVDACAVILWIGVDALRAARRGRLRRRVLGPDRRGRRRGQAPRALIDRAIGPVWEANHVWLIFVLVVLWTAFPRRYSSILSTLFIPFTLAALGIVLRGAGFAFRKASTRLGVRRAYGADVRDRLGAHAFFLGAVLGGIASGRVPRGNAAGDIWTSWANPSGAMVGALAVAVCAYLAAVYLIADARRWATPRSSATSGGGALGAGVVTGALALGGILVLRSDAPRTYDRLTDEALPLVLISAVLGVADRGAARARAAPGHPAHGRRRGATVVGRWGVAQWPYILPRDAHLLPGGRRRDTLWWVVAVFGVALVVVVPSIALLRPRPAEPPRGRGDRRRLGHACRDVLADADGVGDRREGRVHRADAGEEAGVHDVEVVELVGLAVRVEHRAWPGRRRTGRCRPGGRRRRSPMSCWR